MLTGGEIISARYHMLPIGIDPIAYERADFAAQLRQFYNRAPLTAIGGSDYHGLGPIGLCRTYVFTREETQEGILDAIRSGRTVVHDRAGHTYGDPALMRLFAEDGRLSLPAPAAVGFLGMFSRIAGILGLTAAALSAFWNQAAANNILSAEDRT